MLFSALNKYYQLARLVLPLLKSYWLLIVLIGILLVSAHLLIQITHQSRNQHVRLQTLEGERDALQVEWGRLLLEESSLVSSARLEQIARQALGLHLPEGKDLQIKRVIQAELKLQSELQPELKP